MNEADGSRNDASRMRLALADQVAEFHQSRRGIAKGEEGIGMLLDSQTDTSLSTGDAKGIGHVLHTRI